eukprot:jgi/Mesvir1/15667/Mv03268-RA.1
MAAIQCSVSIAAGTRVGPPAPNSARQTSIISGAPVKAPLGKCTLPMKTRRHAAPRPVQTLARVALDSTFQGPFTGEPGSKTTIVKRLFSRGEASDSAGFITFFTTQPVYQFGNFDVALDKSAIFNGAQNFFNGIHAVYHDIKAMWEVHDAQFVEMDVSYWRLDGSMVTLPCFDIFRFNGDKVSELRIFMNCNPVFNAALPYAANASVFTGPNNSTGYKPGSMLTHFALFPEAQERIRNGKAPNWSVAAGGPKWPIAPAPLPPAPEATPLIQVLTGTYTAMVRKYYDAVEAGDASSAASFFSSSPVFQTGNHEVLFSQAAIRSHLQGALRVRHEIKAVYEDGRTVVVEMDKVFTRANGSTITLPSCDLFRIDAVEQKFSEQRNFIDDSPLTDPSIKVTSSVFTLAGGARLQKRVL